MSDTKKSSSNQPSNTMDEMLKEKLNHAVTLHQNGDLNAAKLLYENILALQPKQADALHLLGVIALQSEDFQRALSLMDQAISIAPNNAVYYSNRGNVLHELKQLDAALASYNQAIAIEPNYVDAYSNRSSVLCELKLLEEAIASCDQAIAINPNYADAYYNRACALQELDQLEAALDSYNQSIAIRPNNANAYCNRGNVLRALKQPELALASYDQALAIKPDHIEANCNRGNALYELDKVDAALDCYNKTISLKPDYADAYFNRGSMMHKLKQLEEAIVSYNQAIVIKPDYAQAYCNRGSAQHDLKELNAALASYEQAITINPNYADAYYNRGNVLGELNQFAAAVASYDRAIAINPEYFEAYCNRGCALHRLNQLEAAIATYDQAIALKPGHAYTYYNKSLTVLLQGDFEHGWKLYEWRWKIDKDGPVPRPFYQPRWFGDEPIKDKTVLLHGEQGFGDTIQFCRYAQLVSALGARVILEVPTALTGILASLDGVDQVVGTDQRLPDFDYHCPLLSLPLAFKTTLTNIPSAPAYLSADRQKRAFWERQLGAKVKPRVGLVWSGNSGHKRDQSRSLKLAFLLSCLPDNYQYVCLQKELRDTDRPILTANEHIAFFGEQLTDFSDTAALCELMDLVISIDSSVAHLAGALGKETWVLLPFAPDWRWLLDRDDSLWYPSVKLYRQPDMDNWEDVLKRVQVDLLARIDLTVLRSSINE